MDANHLHRLQGLRLRILRHAIIELQFGVRPQEVERPRQLVAFIAYVDEKPVLLDVIAGCLQRVAAQRSPRQAVARSREGVSSEKPGVSSWP